MSTNKQSGLVSLLTVLFFMIFISVLLLGFLKIMSDEQQQTTGNDLSAGALASARSGVEDAKRILLYCSQHPSSDCSNFLNNDNCNALSTNAAFMADTFGITLDSDGQARSSNAIDYNQKYLCMKVQTITDNVTDIPVEKNKSIIIPLQYSGAQPPASIDVSWHSLSRDGKTQTMQTNAAEIRREADRGAPANLRVELIRYKAGDIDLSALANSGRTVFLVPTTSSATNTVDIEAADPRNTIDNQPRSTGSASRPRLIQCNINAEYVCSASLKGLYTTADTRYYARITARYSSTHIRLAMKDAAANTIRFDNVQPMIDVTGRLADSYRRIKTTVSYNAPHYAPESALEIGSGICKKVYRVDKGHSVDDCPN